MSGCVQTPALVFLLSFSTPDQHRDSAISDRLAACDFLKGIPVPFLPSALPRPLASLWS